MEEAFVQNVRPGVVLMISLCDLFVWFLQNYHLKQHANENKTKNEVSSIGLLYGKVVHGEEKNCDWFPERSEFLVYASFYYLDRSKRVLNYCTKQNCFLIPLV